MKLFEKLNEWWHGKYAPYEYSEDHPIIGVHHERHWTSRAFNCLFRWKALATIGGIIVGGATIIGAFYTVRAYYFPPNPLTKSQHVSARLLLDISLDDALRYVHVYSAQRRQYQGADKPSVYQLASWYKLRLSNRSEQSVTVSDVTIQCDDILSNGKIPTPFFRKIYYSTNYMSASGTTELPLRLEANETIDLYALLPIAIPKELGPILLNKFRANSQHGKSTIELLLFGKEPIIQGNTLLPVRIEGKDVDLISSSTIKSSDIYDMVSPRILLSETASGISFLDHSVPSKDGFVFRKTTDIINELGATQPSIYSNALSLHHRFNNCELIFTTNDGSTSTLKLISSPTLLEYQRK